MGSRVELFEQIRRDRDREGLSIRAPAARHGVHRRAVRQALASPLPPVKRSPAHRPAPKLGAYRALIDGVDEHGADVAETTVRDLCPRAQARDGLAGRRGVRAAGARAGRRGGGRLGAGAGRAGRDGDEGASVPDAGVVLGRDVLPGVAGRDPAGVPGAARAGVWLVASPASASQSWRGPRCRALATASPRLRSSPPRRFGRPHGTSCERPPACDGLPLRSRIPGKAAAAYWLLVSMQGGGRRSRGNARGFAIAMRERQQPQPARLLVVQGRSAGVGGRALARAGRRASCDVPVVAPSSGISSGGCCGHAAPPPPGKAPVCRRSARKGVPHS